MSQKIEEVVKAEPETVPAPVVPLFKQLNMMVGKGIQEYSMPGGIVSESGVLEVVRLVREAFKDVFPRSSSCWKEKIDEIGLDWVTKEGTWAKRCIKCIKKDVSHNGFIHDKYGDESNKTPFKDIMTQPLVSEIGSIISRNTEHDTTFRYDITDSFDWDEGEFGDDGSCFWGSERAGARPAMEGAGFLALRFYQTIPEDTTRGKARCWIGKDPVTTLPVMFNGYGMDLIRQVRILSTILGCMYHKCGLSNNGSSDGILYINGCKGFMLGNLDIPEAVDFKIDIEREDSDRCYECGRSIDEDTRYSDPNGDYICNHCYHDHYCDCARCGRVISHDNSNTVNGDETWCSRCTERYAFYCDHCNEYTSNRNNMSHSVEGEIFCDNCANELDVSTCNGCDKEFKGEDLTARGDALYCEDCLPEESKEETKEEDKDE